MNRESLGRILLLIVIGIPNLCITWLLTQLIDQSLNQAADLRARITNIEARQAMDARTLMMTQISQRSDEGSVDFVRKMLSMHMDSTMRDDMRNWTVLVEMQSDLQDVKRDTEAMRAKIDPPRRLFGPEAEKP